MAGTGHSYEVVNAWRAKRILAELAERVGYPEGRDWFLSAQILRYATGPDFVVRPGPSEAADAIEACVDDPRVREILLAKLERGADLRLFLPEILQRCGADLGHVADWLLSLPNRDPRMIAKLRRVTLASALVHADRWVAALAKEAAGRIGIGRTSIVLDSRPGMIWLELEDGDALELESLAMSHCVRSYADRLGRGTRILSLRDRAGASLATVELLDAGDGASFVARQIRGVQNKPPPGHARQDILNLFNHLKVSGDLLNEAAALSITRDAEGAWRCVSDVAERVELCGMPGFRLGNAVHVVSRVNPDRILAILVGRDGWWTGADAPYRLMGVDADHAILDQRAVATLANELKVDPANVPYLVRGSDGKWTPWIDTCSRVDVGGVECHERDGKTYLLSDSRRHILLEIEKEKAKIVAPWAEWPVSYVRRVARVMTAMKANLAWEDQKSLRSAGLTRGPDGVWYRFHDEAVEHEYRGARSDEGNLRWLVAPWRIALASDRGREMLVFDCASDGSVRWNQLAWADWEHLDDGVRLLNELGRGAAPTFEIKWQVKSDGSHATLVRYDGAWRILKDKRGLVADLKGMGRRQYRDYDCTRAALSLLGDVDDPEVEAILAGHYGIWAGKVKEFNIYALSGMLISQSGPCWKKAVSLRRLMTPSQRRGLGRAAATTIRNAIGRSRRPNRHNFHLEASVRELVLSAGADLPRKCLQRAIGWLLSGFRDLMERDGKRIDRRWFEMAGAVDDCGKSRALIGNAAASTLWALRVHRERMDLSTPERFADWLDCLDLASRYSWRSDKETTMSILIEEMGSRSGSPGWDHIAGRLDALRAVPLAA